MLIFEEMTQDEVMDDAAKEKKLGRDAELLALRNEQILHRYVFYIKQHLVYPKVVNLLMQEFRLSESTIGQMLNENEPEVTELRKNFPTTAQLNKKYPFANWERKVSYG